LLRVQTLLQHPVAVSDPSFVPHPRLRRRHRHRSLSKDAHSMLRCGRQCYDLLVNGELEFSTRCLTLYILKIFTRMLGLSTHQCIFESL